jgi:hypothetical protein
MLITRKGVPFEDYKILGVGSVRGAVYGRRKRAGKRDVYA